MGGKLEDTCKLEIIPGETNNVGCFCPCTLYAMLTPSHLANSIGNGPDWIGRVKGEGFACHAYFHGLGNDYAIGGECLS